MPIQTSSFMSRRRLERPEEYIPPAPPSISYARVLKAHKCWGHDCGAGGAKTAPEKAKSGPSQSDIDFYGEEEAHRLHAIEHGPKKKGKPKRVHQPAREDDPRMWGSE